MRCRQRCLLKLRQRSASFGQLMVFCMKPGSIDDLNRYAPRIGLPKALLEEALAGRFDDKIDNDFSGGARSGVNGTPSVFINGVRYDGERDADSIPKALNLSTLHHANS
jgi:hypothetical protein